MLQKTETPGIFKNTKTGVIVNKNTEKLSAYKRQKKILSEAAKANETMLEMKTQMAELQATVTTLQKTVKTLSTSLKKLENKTKE